MFPHETSVEYEPSVAQDSVFEHDVAYEPSVAQDSVFEQDIAYEPSVAQDSLVFDSAPQDIAQPSVAQDFLVSDNAPQDIAQPSVAQEQYTAPPSPVQEEVIENSNAQHDAAPSTQADQDVPVVLGNTQQTTNLAPPSPVQDEVLENTQQGTTPSIPLNDEPKSEVKPVEISESVVIDGTKSAGEENKAGDFCPENLLACGTGNDITNISCYDPKVHM